MATLHKSDYKVILDVLQYHSCIVCEGIGKLYSDYNGREYKCPGCNGAGIKAQGIQRVIDKIKDQGYV